MSLRRWIIVALTIVASAVAFTLLRNHHDFFDLRIYMSATRWWADGNDLYDFVQPDRVQGQLYFTYPPFAALLLLPFTFLPVWVTATLFTIGTVVAVIVTTRWMLPRSTFAWLLAAPLILLIEPLRETIVFGQINMLLVVLVMMDMLGKSKWKGVGIGLATALKLFPGIFIVYLLVTRQWRAAWTAMGVAAGVTLLAAAVAPRASWDFWTSAIWDTTRVGRTDYTGNQSLLGMLSRLVAPEEPNRVIWLILALATLVFGLWRAARATDLIAALALTGLVAGLISPITWPHHLYWFAPALIVVTAAAFTKPAYWLLAIGGYAVAVAGVNSLHDWGVAAVPTDTVGPFLARNAFVLLSLILLIVLPIRTNYPTLMDESAGLSGSGSLK